MIKFVQSFSISTLVCFSIALSVVVKSHAAEKADNNRNYLIDKLHRVVTNLAPSDSAKNGIILRLADLLSDRARHNTMLLSEGPCKTCISPEVDRKKALQYYNEAYPKVAEANKAKVLVQMGHLNQLLGNQNAAVDIYTRITNESSDQVARSEAFLAIGEIFFKKSEWNKAQSYYDKSIDASNNESKGYATYRLAWSHFNQGHASIAKEKLLTILKTPALLSKSGSNQAVTDVAFHEQVAKDYAIICGANFDEVDLKNIFEFSPEKKKLENLFAVSSELERTAKKKEALIAWNFLYQNQPQPQDRAVTKAHLATVNLQLGKNTDALKDINEAYALIAEAKVKFPNEAEDARRLIKSSIITWNQAEKKKPSAELLEAYQGYLTNYGFEKEMSQWAVQIAADLKKWDVAWSIHKTATNSVATNSKDPKAAATDFENHLLLGIELGESSKDPAVLAEAQNEYLANSKSKSKYWEVFYQKAYTGYEKAENEEFLKPLATIVESKEAPADLRVKSGDLYLDYLAAKKKDAEIEVQARTFHKLMTGVKGYDGDWAKIAEKSVLNQVAANVQANNLSAAWEKIESFQVKNADAKDVITYYKNKVIIAEKRNDINAAYVAAKDLSALKGADKEDKIFAQAKMAYYSDLKMDFKAALSLTEQLPESIIATDKKNLKLAMYSDLLGQNSTTYLKKFVETSKDQASKEAAVVVIINKSSNMDDDIKKQEKSIATSYIVLGQLAALSYAKNGDKSYGRQMVEKNAEIRKTSFGAMVTNDQKLKTLGALGESIEKMALDADIGKKDFQKKLGKDMNTRIQAFAKLDELTADAIKTKNWTLQVVALSLIARESDRFYSEILSLPMPEGLSSEEQGEYMRLLGEKAEPYKAKAAQAKAKATEFWSDNTWQTAMTTKLSGNYAALAQNEKVQLTKVADDKNKAALAGMAAANAGTAADKDNKVLATAVSAVDIETAKAQVKNEPFNVSKIQTLKDLETKNGNRAMVQYLEGRINDLNTSVKEEAKGVL
jgi:hypothetical protein